MPNKAIGKVYLVNDKGIETEIGTFSDFEFQTKPEIKQMAELPSVFDSSEVDDDFEVAPKGDYVVTITDSEMKKTKAGNGSYLNLQMKIMKGEHKGLSFFEMLNLDNPNPKAVEIARKKLKNICDACRKLKIKNSEALHDIPFKAFLDVIPAGDWPAKNKLVRCSPLEATAGGGEASNPFADE